MKILISILFLASILLAHGGQYRGPGDVVPPGPGGGSTGRPSGPTTGGPAGPTTGGPAGPATGSPAGPATGGPVGPRAPGRGPQTGGRGSRLGNDLTQWQFWWEFNKDPFIKLKDALGGGPQTGSDDFYLGSTRRVTRNSLAPTKEDKVGILATLRRAMKSTNNKDIISACMIAMAKVGMDHPEFKLKDVFKPYLKSLNQEVRETAALALGIAAQTESDELDILIALALGKEVK